MELPKFTHGSELSYLFILFIYLVSKKEALAFFSAFENSFKFAKPLRKSSQEKLRHKLYLK